MTDRDVCFCCLEEAKEGEEVFLPCCGKCYCKKCSEEASMRSFFESRGCPLCRKTDHIRIAVEYTQFHDFRITLEKDGNAEVYSTSARCSRYISAEYVRAFQEAIKLCSQTCEWKIEPNLTPEGGRTHHLICDRTTEAKIDLIREEFMYNLTRTTYDYLAHIVTTKYRRAERPPALRYFVGHSEENPVWERKDVPIKFTDHISQLIRIDNVAMRMVQLKGMDVNTLSRTD